MTQISLDIQGIERVAQSLQRLTGSVHDAQRAVITETTNQYRDALVKETPVGKGEKPGRLAAGYRVGGRDLPNGYEGQVTNTTPHLRYVLRGRGRVVAKRGKVLRFVINGTAFYRRRVGPAKANRFDIRVRQQMQPVIRSAGLEIRNRALQSFGRG